MKTRILFLMLFIATASFSQSLNNYKAIIIPVRYEFQKSDNQYRLQTFTKFNLQKAGFEAYYSNEQLPDTYIDRCTLLYLDVIKERALLVTKLYITLKDCNSKLVFKSELGSSREKDFGISYRAAINEAFESIYGLHYAYNGVLNSNVSVAPLSAGPQTSTVKATVSSASKNNSAVVENTEMLFAQPTSYGYQLVDKDPKVIFKIYKTSNPMSYMAAKGTVQGVLVSKNNEWFFEYYKEDKFVSEKINVKF